MTILFWDKQLNKSHIIENVSKCIEHRIVWTDGEWHDVWEVKYIDGKEEYLNHELYKMIGAIL